LAWSNRTQLVGFCFAQRQPTGLDGGAIAIAVRVGVAIALVVWMGGAIAALLKYDRSLLKAFYRCMNSFSF